MDLEKNYSTVGSAPPVLSRYLKVPYHNLQNKHQVEVIQLLESLFEDALNGTNQSTLLTLILSAGDFDFAKAQVKKLFRIADNYRFTVPLKEGKVNSEKFCVYYCAVKPGQKYQEILLGRIFFQQV